MESALVFVALFTVATIVAIIVRRFPVPYTVALVIAGFVLGATHVFQPPHLTKELLYTIFLPSLIFEAAFHLDFAKFIKNKLAIHALAIPGVVAAIALTAIILTPVANALGFVNDFTLKYGLVFAAIIAATDPIAVVGLFKSLGAPKRLAILVEGESLVNDGTAIVFFTLIMGIVTGGNYTYSGIVLDFVKVVGMGVLIGAAIGFTIAKVIQQIDDPVIEITLTVIAAYGSFAAAEHFHYSGVMAVVAAGMLSGNYAARTGMSPSTRISVETFWEYIAFALNSIIFLLIGFEVTTTILFSSWKPIAVAFLAVIIARALVVFAVSALLRPTRERIGWDWSVVLTWGGLRGGLSMVLALGLPLGFPHRDLIIAMTFGVVIMSILVQGFTMSPLLRRLKLVGSTKEQEQYEVLRGLLKAATAACKELDQMISERSVPVELLNTLKAEYSRRMAEIEKSIEDLHLEKTQLREEELLAARRRLLIIEKDSVMQAYHNGMIGQEALDILLVQLNTQLLSLEKENGQETDTRAGVEREPLKKQSVA